MMKSMLESANEPVTDLSYFECLDSVMEKSKVGYSVTVPLYVILSVYIEMYGDTDFLKALAYIQDEMHVRKIVVP